MQSVQVQGTLYVGGGAAAGNNDVHSHDIRHQCRQMGHVTTI